MKVWLVLLVVFVAGALPMLAGPRLLRDGSPRQLVLVSLGSLASMALGFVVVLGVLVDPSDLPATELPELVGRCVGAAGKILDHPFAHWPRVLAALLLLATIGRLAYVGIMTVRDAHREVRSIMRLTDVGAERPGGVVVVRAEQPFAFAAGIIRRRIVVSQGFCDALDADARSAVLAHERAHVKGWHAALLLFGRSVARAFSFLPPVRKAADLLILGLELSADETAARRVGDPMIVARALLDLAESSATRPTHAPAAMGGEISTRIRRLTRGDHTRCRTSRIRSSLAVTIAGATLVILLAALPASARTLTGPQEAQAVHAVCHLPHVSG